MIRTVTRHTLCRTANELSSEYSRVNIANQVLGVLHTDVDNKLCDFGHTLSHKIVIFVID